jgi:hypothetical protein
MNRRREFLFGALATAICAPSVVRSGILMPLRGIILPPERYQFGFVQRLYNSQKMAAVRELQRNGLSLAEIPAELNRRGNRAINGLRWDDQLLANLVRGEAVIQREDALPRAERLSGRPSGKNRDMNSEGNWWHAPYDNPGVWAIVAASKEGE